MPDETLAHPKTDNEILDKVVEFRKTASGSFNQYDRMRKAENFVIGGELQWDESVRLKAKDQGKFTLSIPIVKAQIKQIAGGEIQNPQDFIVENTQGGAAAIANVLTALTKQVGDSESVRYEKSQMFEAGLSSGQGVIGIFINKTDDPKHGDLTIKKLNEHNCLFDRNAQSYDQNEKGTGGRFVIYEEWIEKDEVETEYPDKADELAVSGSSTSRGLLAGMKDAIIDWMVGGDRNNNNERGSFGDRNRNDLDDVTRNRYLKSHTYWKEYIKAVHWFDNRESDLDSKLLLKDSEIAAAKKATKANPEIFSIEEVDTFVMHHTIRVGDTFLEDRVDEMNGVQMFPIIPFWPYWINGYKSGIAEDLIGTQEEINWFHSMTANQVKQNSYQPVIVKEDRTGDKADDLRDMLGKGQRAVINADDYGGKVEFVSPPPFPNTEVIVRESMNNVKTITGRLDIPESDQRALSGTAKKVDVAKTQQGSASIFSNFNYSLAMLGNLIVEIIRKNDIFSEDEIRATIDKEDLIDGDILDQAMGIVINQLRQQGANIPGPPPAINPVRASMAAKNPELQAEILDTFNDETEFYGQFVNQVEQAAIPIAEDIMINLIGQRKTGKYNTKMTLSPMSETMRTIKAIQIFELHRTLREAGDVGLNPEDLINSTDAPNKDELIKGRKKLLASISASADDVSVSRSA
jgi:hypothetical protein